MRGVQARVARYLVVGSTNVCPPGNGDICSLSRKKNLPLLLPTNAEYGGHLLLALFVSILTSLDLCLPSSKPLAFSSHLFVYL